MDLRDATGADPEQLRTSARGWHGVQLAVLGFIGLCGALHDAEAAAGPPVQPAGRRAGDPRPGGGLLATGLVAAEAWPVRETTAAPTGRPRGRPGGCVPASP